MRTWLAEAFGTFVLVLFGTGAIVIDQVSGGAVTHVGVALTFGLVVMAMVYTLGDASGAHLHPAGSLGSALVSGQLGALWIYLLAPTLGALLAVIVCRAVQRPGCGAPGEAECPS